MTDQKYVQTFSQYIKEVRTKARDKYSLTWAETVEEIPSQPRMMEYRDYVVKSFNDGYDIKPSMWRVMDNGLRWRILLTTRALRDKELTSRLKELLPDGWCVPWHESEDDD